MKAPFENTEEIWAWTSVFGAEGIIVIIYQVLTLC